MGRERERDLAEADQDVGVMLNGFRPFGHPTHELDRGLETAEREGSLERFSAAGPFHEFDQRVIEDLFGNLFDHVGLLSHEEPLYREQRITRPKRSRRIKDAETCMMATFDQKSDRPLMNHGRPRSEPGPTTRLAPSPTGDLHLGNARTFLLNWAAARRLGWRIILRHEDLDTGRASEDRCRRIEASLHWLGIDWDGPSTRQSEDLSPYLEAMRRLSEQNLVFQSDLSRRDIREAVGAPHGGELIFPRTLRPGDENSWGFEDPTAGHRFAMPEGEETVRDELQGIQNFNPAREGGDLVLWTRDGRPGYQLAVVVDDLAQGVTDVVRGNDLLASAARQQRLGSALGRAAPPRWWHLPLLHDEEARRLAKRDGDTGLESLQASGVPPARVIGLLLHLAGVLPERIPLEAAEAIDLIDVESLRTLSKREDTTPCRLTAEDLTWLRT